MQQIALLFSTEMKHYANIAQFINDPGSIPSFADILSGSIQTGGSVTVSITIPYGNQATESASALVSTVQIRSKIITPGATDSWQQSWTITPVTDSNTRGRMRALLIYVTTPRKTEEDQAEQGLKDGYDIAPQKIADPIMVLSVND